MLAAIRILLIAIYLIIVSLIGVVFCAFRPFNPSNVKVFADLYAKVAWIIGVKVIYRTNEEAEKTRPAVIIGNHQNSYDIFTISGALPKRGVTIGKKSLKWIPFFGWLYWLSGNILINRENRKAAHGTLSKAADAITKNDVTVWMFPEGTRSYGRGLLKFKRGAFQLAQEADVPIIPIVMNNTHEKIKLNRWNNGYLIVETLAPRKLTAEQSQDLRKTANEYHTLMLEKIEALDAEVAELEKSAKA
ncbi:1-acylglycerol-3-phosphate O-acyltransferase [Catenovulum sp. SM1970]|uniref:1-acylglycerol-3-phosphate O-acyltransferase n=1 Tax=Marinifaba aquimaris TaxID=2741323 RepID=UPI0015736F7B|nr:1-acylglycerol-3-phosphate O-acyltransferase [Marinifaba aquimaris]NTS78306.1 1-acylglycerol-3-phosphate O-acyltransferase [Marinifaba aquimaris]